MQIRRRVNWHAADVDLEVEMTADTDRVACLADGADPLPLPDPLPPSDQRRAGHVGVEVGPILAFAVDQQVVAVEDRVVAAAQDAAVADRDQLGTADGDDVEALVGAAAGARCPEFADRPARAVGALDREDVAVIGNAALLAGDLRRSGNREGGEEEESEKGWALQWWAMTRSTMLYSFASSALMK